MPALIVVNDREHAALLAAVHFLASYVALGDVVSDDPADEDLAALLSAGGTVAPLDAAGLETLYDRLRSAVVTPSSTTSALEPR